MDIQPWAKNKKYLDFQNNTNISLRHRYCYFAIDKVANSTIKYCLYMMEYKSARLKESILNIYDPRASPLLSPYQIPEEILKDAFFSDNYFRFAFVRNPYSRLLSCYLDRIRTLHSRPSKDFVNSFGSNDFSFSDFVAFACSQNSHSQNSHWRLQFDDLMLGSIKDTKIYKFENLKESMLDVSNVIFGVENDRMLVDNVNASPKKTNSTNIIGKYYTQELLDMVYERYKKDFEIFNYSRSINP